MLEFKARPAEALRLQLILVVFMGVVMLRLDLSLK